MMMPGHRGYDGSPGQRLAAPLPPRFALLWTQGGQEGLLSVLTNSSCLSFYRTKPQEQQEQALSC